MPERGPHRSADVAELHYDDVIDSEFEMVMTENTIDIEAGGRWRGWWSRKAVQESGQPEEPSDANRSPGKDRKAATVATAKQRVVELEKKRLAAVKVRNEDLVFKLVNDIRLAKIELKEALQKTVEDYAREADAEAEEAVRKADAEAKEAVRKADAEAKEAARKADDEAKFGPKTATNTIDMGLMEIPAGTFTMGSPAGEKGRQANEEQVSVTLTKPFRLGKTEVTQGQWKQVMGTEPWKGRANVQADKDCPATYVSLDDALEFCETLTDLERKAGKLKANEEYRLPTEAEWEYACRAGTTTAFSFGDDKKQLGEYAWICGNASSVGEKYAHKVGLKKPNPWGLHDMHGNVSEWCSDWLGYSLRGGVDPVGPGGDHRGVNRAVRGGGWVWSEPGFCRSAYRFSLPPYRSADIGFRVARSQSAQ